MVKLTGEMGEEAQMALSNLHDDIEAGKKIVTATHNFEEKLHNIDHLIGHVQFNYMDEEDFNELFMELSDALVELREELEALEKGEVHIILEEEAAEKRGVGWILKHRKKIEGEKHQEEEIAKEIIEKLHAFFVRVKKIFTEAEHLFEVDIKKATVKEMKMELEEKEEEVKHILERLLQFILAYEKIIERVVKRI